MGIAGKLSPSILSGEHCSANTSLEFIEEVLEKTKQFYGALPIELEYKGIISECESFIYNITKYIYLFTLCTNE